MQGRPAHHLLQEAVLLREKMEIKGFRLLDYGPFPVVMPGASHNKVIGEMYEVNGPTLKKLDIYEGVPTLYKRAFLVAYDTFIYLGRKRESFEHLPVIEHGDWNRFLVENPGVETH